MDQELPRAAQLLSIGADLHDAALVVVAVHGRGQTPAYVLEHLVEPLTATNALDHVAWVLPAAEESSWYPNSFLAPLADNEPHLSNALATLGDVATSLSGRDPRTVVWAGFSQGACLVCEFVARWEDGWGGLLALTGGMIGPPGTDLVVGRDRGDRMSGMPAYFGVGDDDDWVPLWRVEETAEAYRRAGADVTLDVFPGRPHEICEVERQRALTLLTTL
jgi:phospholipase/carboxylesterase